MAKQNHRFCLRNHPASASALFRVHPTINPGDMLAGDFRHLVDAEFRDDGLGWFEMFFAHNSIFAIIAILSQVKFAISAIDFFAHIAIIAL